MSDILIDQDYERQVGRLTAIEGSVNDYPITPARAIPAQSPRQSSYMPGHDQAALTPAETSMIGQTQQAVGAMMQWTPQSTPDTSHTRQVDSAVTVAQASIIAARSVIVVHGVTTLAMIALAWRVVGGPLGVWALGWLVIWGGISQYALIQNRKQGLHHSSTGIAHHALDNQAVEISEKYQTARYAINRTFEFVERQRAIGANHDRDHSQ